MVAGVVEVGRHGIAAPVVTMASVDDGRGARVFVDNAVDGADFVVVAGPVTDLGTAVEQHARAVVEDRLAADGDDGAALAERRRFDPVLGGRGEIGRAACRERGWIL